MQKFTDQIVDHLFRHESGKMIAVLSKLLGLQNFQTAQDIVQDTLLQALRTWSYKGLPENPVAWLYRAAKNKAVDHLRREKNFVVFVHNMLIYFKQNTRLILFIRFLKKEKLKTASYE